MDRSEASHKRKANLGRTRGSNKRLATDDLSMGPPSAAKRKIIIKVPTSMMARRHSMREVPSVNEDMTAKNTRGQTSIAKDGTHTVSNELSTIATRGWKPFINDKPPVRIVIVGRWRATWLASTARRCREADEAAQRAAEEAHMEHRKANLARLYMKYISGDTGLFATDADSPFLRHLARTHMADLATETIRTYLRESIMNTADFVELMKWYDFELMPPRERRVTVANRDAGAANTDPV